MLWRSLEMSTDESWQTGMEMLGPRKQCLRLVLQRHPGRIGSVLGGYPDTLFEGLHRLPWRLGEVPRKGLQRDGEVLSKNLQRIELVLCRHQARLWDTLGKRLGRLEDVLCRHPQRVGDALRRHPTRLVERLAMFLHKARDEDQFILKTRVERVFSSLIHTLMSF